MKTGIYSIKNTKDGKVYVGLSTKIETRFHFHRRRLRNGKHKNEHLQSAWNKHGEESFEFGIIEECSEEMLNDREIFWIAQLNSMDRTKGYNKCAGGGFGRMSPEIIKRTAAILRTKTIPEEQRKRISQTLTGKKRPDRYILNEEGELDVVKDFNDKMKIRHISVKHGISTTAVYNILKRRNK